MRDLVKCLMTLSLGTLLGCQDYLFELRPPKRVDARAVHAAVANVTPVDILFVVDNSGSMLDERNELRANIDLFVGEMIDSGTDFQVGIVTTDVECNVPERDCSFSGRSSAGCCALMGSQPLCSEVDVDHDGTIDWSDCDGGRLRAPTGHAPYFSRPAASARQQWITDFNTVLSDVGCNGSNMESGLEAMRRALTCARFGNSSDCGSESIAQLNAGFLRDNADLVVILISDEDDCSFLQASTYLKPQPASNALEQASHLCGPTECYAHQGAAMDRDNDGLMDWADPQSSGTARRFRCSGNDRTRNPPLPDDVGAYLDALVAVKDGDITRVRAAAITGGVLDSQALLGMRGSACMTTEAEASDVCGCWSASLVQDTSFPNDNFYCELTGVLRSGSGSPFPVNSSVNECGLSASSDPQPGCGAMPGTRYVQFLEALSARRSAALVRSDTLVDAICQQNYSSTMFSIVNTVILTRCFELPAIPGSVDELQVSKNGKLLANSAANSGQDGWSWLVGAQEICLEGSLQKKIGDQYEILMLTP